MSQSGSASSSGGGGSGVLILNYTLVNTTPYTTVSTDEFLGVDTTTLSITVRLPDAPVVGRVYVVKDITGLATLRNITVTTVGGTVLIDNASAFIMNSSLESIQVLFNGTKYLVF